MKNLFKFTAAAVALFAFASCSDDISEFGGNSADFTAANELKIEAEEMDGGNLASGTRSAYVGTTNARVWQETDMFKVFGPKIIGMYDYYKYSKSSNKFVIDGNKDVDEAAFVGFPNAWMSGQDWDKASQSGYLQYDIPAVLDTYDEVAGSDPVAYVSNLPLWGTAENDGDGIKAKVYFLTAIIKVSLENADGNAKAVRVVASKNIAGTTAAPIAGTSKVQVSKNGTAYAPADVQLPAPTAGSNKVIMPLGDLSKKATNSVIYLPLIAGTYGNVKVQYTNETPATDKTYADIEDSKWTDINTYKNKEFKRGTCYGKDNTKSFTAAAENVKGLNDLLKGMTSASGEVEVTCANNIAVGTDAAVGNNIVLPAMPSVTSLTLDFATDKQFTAGDAGALTISGDYAGTFILNATSASNVNQLNIQLPNANVVIAQPVAKSKFNFEYAKNVQFGGVITDDEDEYTTLTFTGDDSGLTFAADVADVTIWEGATVGDFTIPADHLTAKVDVQGTAGNITIDGLGLNEGATAVTVSGIAGNITINGDKNTATVEVSGTAGAISTAGSGSVALSGKATSITTKAGAVSITGAPVYATPYYKVLSVTTEGNVTVNLDNEGAAIGNPSATEEAQKGGLTMNAAATLTLTQGYVNKLTYKVAAKKSIELTFGAEKYVNLGAATAAEGNAGTLDVKNAPAWNGEVFGGSIDETAEQTEAKILAENVTAITTAWEKYKNDGTAIYTPIDLAANKSTAFTLANDIDLNNKAWEPAASATEGTINGNGHTISKLTLAVQEDKNTAAADAGRGLFTILSIDVSNLTLDGVTVAAVPYKVNAETTTTAVSNIGALAGKTTEGVTVSNVTVKNAALSTTGGGANVGGLFGTVTRSATADDALVLNGVNFSGTIAGYHSLGGLIGSTVGNITIAQIAKGATLYGTTTAAAAIPSSATATFTSNFDSESINDLNYLKVGNFIGTIGLSGDETTISSKIAMTDVANVKPTLNYTKIYTGTTKYATVVDDAIKYYDVVSDKQTLIGWCGANTFAAAANVATINKNSSDADLTYPILLNKADLDNLTAAQPNYLYYINK